MSTFTSAGAVRQFDHLVSTGELFYTPCPPQPRLCDDIDFEFRLSPSLGSKPAPFSPTTAEPSHRPPPTDGSDIDHADPAFALPALPSPWGPLQRHKLILNKFCLFRPQYMLLTLDPLKRQGEPLSRADLAAAWAVLCAAAAGDGGREHYVVYNGGREAGGSRRHKHLQVLPMPGRDGDAGAGVQAAERGLWPRDASALPFVHFDLAFSPAGHGTEEALLDLLAATQAAHVRRCRDALGLRPSSSPPDDSDAAADQVDHNVILTRWRMLTLPRRRGTLPELRGHNVGAQGMLGLVWCGKEEQVKGWEEVGPAEVLGRLGVPKGAGVGVRGDVDHE